MLIYRQSTESRMTRFAFIILLCLLAAPLYAFEQIATLEVNKRSAQIGESLELQIKVKIGKNDILFSEERLRLPAPFEFNGEPEIDSSSSEYYKDYEIKARFTSFDGGAFQLGPIYFGRSQNVATNSVTVEFTAPSVDTAAGFRDIKPPLSPKRGFWDNLPYALFIVIALLIGYYLYKRINRRPKVEIREPKPIAPPYYRALERLGKLKEQGPQELKIYYTELSLILREYISEVWRANALEVTTEELLGLAKANKISDEAIASLKFSLQLSDLVKFAKLNPNPEATDTAIQNAIGFIELTKERSIKFEMREETDGN